MAFGFFKKPEKADIIFTGGKIYTQDPNQPYAEAVACKDGKIIAVGDAEIIMDFEASDTEVVDLEGGTMLPGFIDIYGCPEKLAFKDAFIDISSCEDFDAVLGFLSDYIAENPDTDGYFASGLENSFTAERDMEDIKSTLDNIIADKPLFILQKDGNSAIFNTYALEKARSIAIEEQVEFLTVPFLINSLLLLDFDEIQHNTLDIAANYCERGFTSIVSGGTLDYFDATYQDILIEMFQNGMLKQRYYGLFSKDSPQDPQALVRKLRQKQTMCVDMEGLIAFNGMVIDTTSDKFDGQNLETLKEMCIDIADAGFNIKIEVKDKETALAVIDIFETVQSKGYRKNILTLAHDIAFTDEERANFALGELIAEASPAGTDFLKNAKNVEDAIDILTIDAAILIGMQDSLGTIAIGKRADFAIFSENPLECQSLEAFKKLRAAMTVLNGEIVYDEQEDICSEWYELMTSQQY